MLPSKAETILQILSEKFDGKPTTAINIPTQTDESYQVLDGMATIEMKGTLVKTGSWASALSGIASYTSTQAMLSEAIQDPDGAIVTGKQ